MSLIYLIQVTSIWLVCYLFYMLWLRPENLPVAKRYFLLGSLLTGLLLPFLPSINLLIPSDSPALGIFIAQLETITVVAHGQGIEDHSSSYLSILLWIWAIGSAFSLFRLTRAWLQLFRLIKKGSIGRQLEGYNLVSIPSGGSPFSYANYLFWPTDLDLSAPKWAAVKAHEEAHIKQGHTYDLLIIDLLTILFWWNPLPYLFRRSIRLQHEYLADAAATRLQKSNVRDYAQLLLQHQLVGWVPSPGHAFHHSHLKNRIIMLTQPKGSSWKLLAILPLFIMLLWACNEEAADITGVNIAEAEAEMADKRQNEEAEAKIELVDGQKVYKQVEQMPIYGDCSAELSSGDIEEAINCGNTKLLTDIYTNIKYPAVARESGAEGMVVLSFIVPASGGKATNIEVMRSASRGLKASKSEITGDKTVQVVGSDSEAPLLTANEQTAYDALDAAALETAMNLPQDWTPGQHDGKAVAVRFNLPIKFKLK